MYPSKAAGEAAFDLSSSVLDHHIDNYSSCAMKLNLSGPQFYFWRVAAGYFQFAIYCVDCVTYDR